MGLQIRTYINGIQKHIDLYGDEDITMEYSFAEIQDITKRNSSFTQEFKVPGTNNNNEIFDYFFDINSVSVPLGWNPKKKFEASLIYDGYEIFTGNIRLNGVTINKLEKIYSVTFYTSVGDLAANIGDKDLCEVDTTSLNHNLWDPTVTDWIFRDPSLHPTSLLPTTGYWGSQINPITEGKVQYILANRGYDYNGGTSGTIADINTNSTPLIEFSGVTGFFDNYQTPISTPYLIPAIQTRELYSLIVNQADYQIESYFFDTDYFKRYYVPLSFNSDSLFLPESYQLKFQIYNSSGQTSANGGKFLNVYTGSSAITSQFIYSAKEIVEDSSGLNPVDYTQYPNLPKLSAVTNYIFALPESPTDPIKLDINMYYQWIGPADPSGFFRQVGRFRIYELVDVFGSGPTLEGIPMGTPIPLYADTSTPAVTQILNTTFTLTPTTSNGNGTNLYFIAVEWYYSGMRARQLRVTCTNNPTVLPNIDIELNKDMSCDQKQIDFIQNVNRMFNLVVVPHPTKPKTVVIEPLVDWIGKGKQLDWTDKVDFDSPQTLRPTSTIINGTIFAANKQDKDFVNTEYNIKTNKIFGQNNYNLGIDYKNSTTNLTQTLGQNTDYYLNASGATNIAVPCYFITKEENVNGNSIFQYRPFRSLPRMIFKSVPLASGNTGQGPIFYRFGGVSAPVFTNYGLVATTTIPNINRLTTYPFAISGFSHYTVYDSTAEFTPDELIYPEVESQYDRYYKDYIDDLSSEENKIYNCKMYLTPWEVSQLETNEVIFIKNAKFRINKISNLSLIEPGMCDVELIKLTKDYTPTPTLFYDLISCDDECDIIHSNTDLNYLLWAFDGQYVYLDVAFNAVNNNKTIKKYKVVRTTYNQDYTYENVYFDVRTTAGPLYTIDSDYSVFSSCTSETVVALNPYNTFTGYTGSCIQMSVTNTGSTQSVLNYVDCSGNTKNYIINPNVTIDVCGIYGTFQGNSLTYCADVTADAICEGLPPYPNTLTWGFAAALDEYNVNITNPQMTVTQVLNSQVLVNTTSFVGMSLVQFASGYLDIMAKFTYQNNAGSINNIAIVAGTFSGDDSYGRLDIPNPGVGVTYTLNVSQYFPSSGNLYVAIITS